MKTRASKSVPHPKKSISEKIPVQNTSFPIVAVGASAGGLEAYTDFFHALPVDTGMAFVLIQHLDPSHHSLLAEILAKATRMPVEEVKSGVKIRSNRVYVIPPDAFMAIDDCAFVLTPRSKEPGQHLSVNFFMRSLAAERKSLAIGIVLSGTGGDGTLGLEDIKAEGGITFAQEPTSARYDGMPRSAIDSGCVDFVLPPRGIAKELDRLHRHPYVRQEEQDEESFEADSSPSREADFATIVTQLRKASGVDFRQYKPNTIHRRASRRMMILKLDSLSEYAKYLKDHPEEGGKLYDDVLIPVTSFFRDFEAFEALKSQVYPAIVNDKANKGTIRMWAPGCSTGEETYSLAMTLLEFLGDRAPSFHVQIFGTDLNEKGIQKARTGLYRESIAEEISPERMRRFFVKEGDGYRVNKAVRDLCVFARQNLANDPPFSQMNIVACRNLLIYIQPVLQKKIVPILHYALKPAGFLVLGSSESVAAFPDLFSTVDKKHKIYGKKATASRLHYDFAQPYYSSGSGGNPQAKSGELDNSHDREGNVEVAADRLVLRDHAPVGVVINNAMEVVQFRGRTTPYLEPAPGKPTVNVLKLARNGLALELRSLIGAARKKNAAVKKNDIALDGDGRKRVVSLSVSPFGTRGASDKEDRYFLILFEDVTGNKVAVSGDGQQHIAKGGTAKDREIKRLKQELADAQDTVRASTESEDGVREEFQSANEEILSANEELQSTNEELETSKEELQSANEEMSTLNHELGHKNAELHDVNNDLSNFLNSAKIPIVMLDSDLRIRRLTPSADVLVKAVSSDVGRSIADIRLNVKVPDLEEMIATVVESLQPAQREVLDREDRWHSLHILPYRTLDNKIDGVVLVLQDIHAIKTANEQIRKSAEFLRGIIDTVREPLLVLDAELRVIALNQTFQSAFKVPQEKTIGKFLYDLGDGQWNIPELRALLEKVLAKRQTVTDFEVKRDFESIGQRTMLLNARTLTQPHGDAKAMILLAIEDITESRQAEERALDLRQRLEQQQRIYSTTLSSIADFAYIFDREGRFRFANQPLLDLWGLKLEDALGKTLFELPYPEEDAARVQGQIQQVFDTGKKLAGEMPYTSPAGVAGYYEYIFHPVVGADGTVELVAGSTHDLTERRRSEAALIKSEKLAAAGRLAATLAHEINNPLQAVTNLLSLLGQFPGLDAQHQAYATMAEEELTRVTYLTQQSLGFYRESISPTTVNVEEVIENILNLYAKPIAAKNIKVSKQYQSDGAAIDSYPGEIRQVFSTLLVNAMEAVPIGGTIAIRVRKSLHRESPANKGVRITIADSGVGIPAKNKVRIFEPFFTTKGEQGTGLGLWVANGIVNRLGGSIRMRSTTQPGRSGTCFSIFLPDRTPGKS